MRRKHTLVRHLACLGVLAITPPSILAQVTTARGIIEPKGIDVCLQGTHWLTNPCTRSTVNLQSSTIPLFLLECEAYEVYGPDVGISCLVIEVQGLIPRDLECEFQVTFSGSASTDQGTGLSWDRLPCINSYDVIRGELPVGADGALGSVTCIADDLDSLSVVDADLPVPDSGFFYLARGNGRLGYDNYGYTSAHLPRIPSEGDCSP